MGWHSTNISPLTGLWKKDRRNHDLGNGVAALAQPYTFTVGDEMTRLKSSQRLLTSSPTARVKADELNYTNDGWNLLAILNSSSALTESFTWGLDLSGTMQGAGGVGGLLWVTQTGGQSAFTAFDGNGNVSALINAVDGTSMAQYEYGPFGEVIRATGSMAKANPFRFSTKYQDDETDFLYYGYRYYNQSTGRWPNHDPLGEKGGINLFTIDNNDNINTSDPIGLDPADSLTGPWNMFFYLIGGDHSANLTLSPGLINQAISSPDYAALMSKLIPRTKQNSNCGQSGSFHVSSDTLTDNSFSLGADAGFANTGQWQVRASADCSWVCENKTSPNCCCNCKAVCLLNSFISKTYTFNPSGYNPLNNSFGIGLLNFWASFDQAYHLNANPNPAYFISAQFNSTYSFSFKKCQN